LWGTDAVHGHNNVPGATVFPHNIGLGATRDPDLVRRIGAATAAEMHVTGQGWAFAPTLAVAQDGRWGRTYESYSSDPAIVARLGAALVEGLQGEAGSGQFLRNGHVVATAKHFLGDGATAGGKDQGDAGIPEAELRDVHGAGYAAALAAGVQTVMASYSSWHGQKMHGNQALLADVLKGRMGFDGFVVGDWNGHAQLPGCAKESCPAAVNAGLDMFMAPDRWKDLYANTLAQAKSGEIPMSRLDDAVRRILRVKARAGLFDAPRPSARPFAGRFDLLGSADHRALARQAVRESLVLLKNDGNLLPLRRDARILVTGNGADDIGRQSGGWTLSWQGLGNSNADFPNGQSIYAGIREAVSDGGGAAMLSPDGRFTDKPDAAVVVFGEPPYAEGKGDRRSLDYSADDRPTLEVLQRLRQAGIPTISVFLSGRPLGVGPEIAASQAFVAAWLPGTEGGGIADLLFRDRDGAIAHDFRGTLPFAWPGDPSIGMPAHPIGFGLHYGADAEPPANQ
jgi:beta-glucosidase